MKQRWSSKALSDLDSIRDYTRKEWGAAQAAKYIRSIRAIVGNAASAPMLAAPIGNHRPEYRKVTAGTHIVFFRINGEAIEIVRILHGAMDIEPKLD